MNPMSEWPGTAVVMTTGVYSGNVEITWVELGLIGPENLGGRWSAIRARPPRFENTSSKLPTGFDVGKFIISLILLGI